MHHVQYLISQINLSIVTDFTYSLVFYYDLVSTKLLVLLSYSNMLSDLAEGFAVSLILLILIVSGLVISIKTQDSVRPTMTNRSNTNLYKTVFDYFNKRS